MAAPAGRRLVSLRRDRVLPLVGSQDERALRMLQHECLLILLLLSREPILSGPTDITRSPRDVFACFQRNLLANDPGEGDDLLAADVVIETPFAPPGHRSRFVGRAEFLAFAKPGRADLPVRFEEIRDIVVHDTADPEVIVAEYELVGVVTTTGRRAAASFVQVLRVRHGHIVHLREYQNALAIAEALGQLPALLASVRDQST